MNLLRHKMNVLRHKWKHKRKPVQSRGLREVFCSRVCGRQHVTFCVQHAFSRGKMLTRCHFPGQHAGNMRATCQSQGGILQFSGCNAISWWYGEAAYCAFCLGNGRSDSVGNGKVAYGAETALSWVMTVLAGSARTRENWSRNQVSSSRGAPGHREHRTVLI